MMDVCCTISVCCSDGSLLLSVTVCILSSGLERRGGKGLLDERDVGRSGRCVYL